MLCDPDRDELVYRAPLRPVIEPVLCEKIMETSLENSNLVGNIYFTNYYSWQGKVRDHYLFGLIPGIFQGDRKKRGADLPGMFCQALAGSHAVRPDFRHDGAEIAENAQRRLPLRILPHRARRTAHQAGLRTAARHVGAQRRPLRTRARAPFPKKLQKALLKAVGNQLN